MGDIKAFDVVILSKDDFEQMCRAGIRDRWLIAILSICLMFCIITSVFTLVKKNAEVAALKKIVATCSSDRPGVYTLISESDDGLYRIEEGFMCSSTSLGTKMTRKDKEGG
jgi:hypothetical protein